MKRDIFFFLFLTIFTLFWRCTKPVPVLENGVFRSFGFEDCISSLDSGGNGYLLIGTTNGKLIFFDPKNSENHSVQVGEEVVYCAFQDTSGLFVGIRNEGLRFFPHNDFTSPHRFRLSFKELKYSVYKVEKYGDTLFCATSNGIALLDLNKMKCDSLIPIYPYLNIAAQDFKINDLKCVRDTLYAAFSSDSISKLLIIHITKEGVGIDEIIQPAQIKSFFASPDFRDNALCIVRQDYIVVGNDSFPNKTESFSSFIHNGNSECPYMYNSGERLVVANDFCPSNSLLSYQLTMPDKSYAETARMLCVNGYTYWLTGKTLCAIPDHYSKGSAITALAYSNNAYFAVDEENMVYKKNGEAYKYDYPIKGLENKKIDQLVMLSDKDLCIFSDNKVYIGTTGSVLKEIGSICPNLQNQKFHCVAYDNASKRLYLGYRRGFAFCSVKNGKIQPASLCMDTTTLSVQCVLGIDSDLVLLGTLNYGCLKKHIRNGRLSDETDTVNKHYDIIDILRVGNDFYYLSPNYLYGVHDDSVKVRNLHKIYAYGDNLIVGVSKIGGLYRFHSHDLSPCQGDPVLPDVFFYPNAIQQDTLVLNSQKIIDSGFFAGTNIGLIRVDLAHPTEVVQVDVKKSMATSIATFIRERVEDVVHFGIPAVLILLLILAVLTIMIYRFNKQKNSLSEIVKQKLDAIKNLDENNRQLKDSNENFSTEINNKKKKIEELEQEINNKIDVLKSERFQKIESLEKHFLLKIKPFNEKMNQLVLSQYHSLTEEVIKKIEEIKRQTINLSSDEFGKQIEEVNNVLTSSKLLKAALNMELENLQEWYVKNKPLKNREKLKDFRNAIGKIRTNFLEHVIAFKKPFRRRVQKVKESKEENTCGNQETTVVNDKRQYYLDIWAICLYIAQTKEFRLRENQELFNILQPNCERYEKEDSDVVMRRQLSYVATLKKEMRESFVKKDKEIFKCKDDKFSALYDEIVQTLIEVLGGYKEYNKSRLPHEL